MKKCCNCKLLKDLNQFHRRQDSKDGHQGRCKECIIALNKFVYKNNRHTKRKMISRSIIVRDKLHKILNNIKANHGCCFCKETNPVCLDFHHKNINEKDYDISTLAQMKSKEKLFNEINKCIIVCANCHRRIHFGELDCSNKPLCNELIENYFDKVGLLWKFPDDRRPKNKYTCYDCGINISRTSKRCQKCANNKSKCRRRDSNSRLPN